MAPKQTGWRILPESKSRFWPILNGVADLAPFGDFMKRILFILLAVIGLIIVTFAALISTAFIGKSAIQAGVVDGFIHVVKDGYVTANVLDIGDGHVALIDAGDDKTGKALLAELAEMKVAPSAVTAILLTHGHPDHVAAAPLFANAKVYVLGPDIALAEGREGAHGPITQLMPVRQTNVHVERALRDGEVLQLGNRAVHVLAIPGHTAGSAAFWVDGNLFLGDSAAANADGTLAAAPLVFTDDADKNRQSIKGLAARLQAEHLDVKMLLPAHTGRLEGIKPLLDFRKGD
jgi:glyoxylase-like metal-dependent hydrolase (beta-lactamase superfamily II)